LRYVNGRFRSAELPALVSKTFGPSKKPIRFARKNGILAVCFQDENSIMIKDTASQFYEVIKLDEQFKDVGKKIMVADLLENESQPDKIRITYSMHDTSDLRQYLSELHVTRNPSTGAWQVERRDKVIELHFQRQSDKKQHKNVKYITESNILTIADDPHNDIFAILQIQDYYVDEVGEVAEKQNLILKPRRVHATISRCFDRDTKQLKDLSDAIVLDGHYQEEAALKSIAQKNDCDHHKLLIEVNRVQSILKWDLLRKN